MFFRYPDPEEIVELPLEGSLTTPVANIAAALDPTYTRESLERNPRQKKSCLKTGKSSEEFLTSSSNRVSQEGTLCHILISYGYVFISTIRFIGLILA